jgi:glycosyltransferase involved in cell wall biosynthesis
MKKTSFVSIGMPVFNGEKYIKQAIDSILAQTYRNFELIVSDNASTDNTEQICLEYAKRDSRISYHRNRENVGGPRNYNNVFELSSGDYFKWTAYDDILAPDYLEKCVRILDEDPSVVLCHSLVTRIDETGVSVGNYDDRTLPNISSWKPHRRFGDLIYTRNTCWTIHGVSRKSCMKKTRLHGDYLAADRVFLVEVGLLGRIFEVPEHLFFRRDHPQAYTSVYYSKSFSIRDYKKQITWWTGGEKRYRIILPHWKLCIEFFKSVNRAKLSWKERLLCYREITKWFFKEGRSEMIWDLANEFKIWRIRLQRK